MFVMIVTLVVCSGSPSETILYLALMSNFLVTVNILTKWNESKQKADAAGTSPATSPLNPPEGFYPGGDFKPTVNPEYDALKEANAPDYGPRFREYDSLRQSHLDMTPGRRFPKKLFAVDDANTRMAMNNIIRGDRVKRSIDDGIIRGAADKTYIYAEELKEQEARHWMSKYEY